MTLRQSKLVRFATQHSVACTPVDGDDRAVEVAVPYSLQMPNGALEFGVDHHTVTTMSELRDALGY